MCDEYHDSATWQGSESVGRDSGGRDIVRLWSSTAGLLTAGAATPRLLIRAFDHFLLFICRRVLRSPFRISSTHLLSQTLLSSSPHLRPLLPRTHLLQHTVAMALLYTPTFDLDSVCDAERSTGATTRPSSCLAQLPADILLEIAHFLNTFSDRLHFSATVSLSETLYKCHKHDHTKLN